MQFSEFFLFGILDFSKNPAIVRFKSLAPIRNSELVSKCAQLGYGVSNTSICGEFLKEMVNGRIMKGFTDSDKLNCSDQALEQ